MAHEEQRKSWLYWTWSESPQCPTAQHTAGEMEIKPQWQRSTTSVTGNRKTIDQVILKNFLSILCGFHIMHSNPTYLPLLLYPPPSKKNAIVEAAGWQADRPVKPFSPYIFTAGIHCDGSLVRFEACLLLLYQYWCLTGAPLGCLVAVLCGGEPAVLELQDHPFHVLWQVIDGVDAGMGQLWT